MKTNLRRLGFSRFWRQQLASLALAAAALTTASPSARAVTWNAAPTSADWSLGANWAGTAPANGNTLVFGASTITTLNDNLTLSSGAISFTGPAYTIGGNDLIIGGTVTNSSTNLQTFNNNLSFSAVRTFTSAAGGGNFALNGIISGSFGMTVAGAGTMTLTGNNTYTGDTTINAGSTVIIGSDTAFGNAANNIVTAGTLQGFGGARTIANPYAPSAATTIAGSSALTFTATALNNASSASIMTINNSALTTFAGGINVRPVGTGLRTMTLAGTGNVDINGLLSGGGSPSSIVSQGSGTIRVSGTSDYNGTTLLTSGSTWLVNGTHTGGTSYTVGNGGATPTAATLGGTGAINPAAPTTPLTVNNLGVVAPGDSTLAAAAQTGTLSYNGTIAFQTGSALTMQIGGNTAGDGTGFYDQLNMLSATSLVQLQTGVTLNLSLVNGYSPLSTDVFYLLTRADATAFGTTFSGLAEGAAVSVGGYTGQITYLANWTGAEAGSTKTGGNDLAIYNLAVVPEPSAFAMLFGGILGLLVVPRLRRRD